MKPARDCPTILFPIDIAVRELDSKLITASALAAQGCRSVVGNKESIMAIALASERIVLQTKELMLFNSQVPVAHSRMDENWATMLHHDEGGMHALNGWEENVLQKHSIDAIRQRAVSSVCLWGRRQKEVLSLHAPEAADTVVVTGSPRFDLCLPSYAWVGSDATAAIRAQHGAYILVCTRFTAIAHAEGIASPFRRKLNEEKWPERIDRRRVQDIWFSKWHGDVTDFAEMVMLIKELAVGFPDRTILLRPHPSESLAFYAQAFSSFKNVVVTREGSVLPWIRAADLVVHSNCTTGIEAVLAGRPTLNLLPEGPARNQTDVAVACEAGLTATSVADAVDKAGQLLSGSVAPHAWSPNAQSMLNNLETEAIPLMAEETMRVLERRKITSSRVSFPRPTLRSVVRRVVKGPDTTAYIRSKRGPLDPEHVERLIYGCRATGVGGGRVSHITPQYAVIDPA